MPMNQAFYKELDQLLAKHNITRSESRGRIILTDLDANEANFRRNARYAGLEPDDYGAIVIIQGQRYKVVGISPNRPKNLFDIECCSTGKGYIGSRSLASQIIAGRASRQPVTTPTQNVPVFQTPQPQLSPSSNNGQTDDRYAGVAQF